MSTKHWVAAALQSLAESLHPVPHEVNELDWKALGQCDYLYVSHLHRDHFDEANLRDNVSKDATVLCCRCARSAACCRSRALHSTPCRRARPR